MNWGKILFDIGMSAARAYANAQQQKNAERATQSNATIKYPSEWENKGYYKHAPKGTAFVKGRLYPVWEAEIVE